VHDIGNVSRIQSLQWNFFRAREYFFLIREFLF